MTAVSIGFGSPVDENGFARLDRQQVATDIGMVSKMLALSSMSLPLSQSIEPGDCLDKYSQLIREHTSKITSEVIGPERVKSVNNGYRRYFPNIQDDIDQYVDYACMIVAELMDGVMASRFYNKESLITLKKRLEEINSVVACFNAEANSIHKIADITYIDESEESIRR